MAYFYSHLIEIDTLTMNLGELDLTDDQRKHLAALVDSTIHQEILDLVLEKLSSEDKKAFVQRIKNDPHNKELMTFLQSKVDNIEEEIKKTAERLKKELHEDIVQVQKGGKT